MLFRSDVAAGRVRAKVLVFLNAWCLAADERRALRQATRGALSVWCYAPGYQEPDRVSLAAMQALTGFKLEQVSPPKAWAEPTEAGRRLGLQHPLGVAGPVEPLFAAADAKPDERLAVYSDGTTAVALRRTAGGDSLFVGPPGLTAELLRLAARRAGAHLFTQTDCNVQANGPFLVLHAAADGPLAVDTGRAGPVRDLLTGQPVSPGPKFTLTLNKGDTRVLVVDPPPQDAR